jgi:hypothetical protein
LSAVLHAHLFDINKPEEGLILLANSVSAA